MNTPIDVVCLSVLYFFISESDINAQTLCSGHDILRIVISRKSNAYKFYFLVLFSKENKNSLLKSLLLKQPVWENGAQEHT